MRGWAAFLLIAALSAAGLIVRALGKPFWHDEIYTILHSSLPTIGTMWRASLDGIDLMPPLNSMLTHGVHTVSGIGLVSTRLVPMAGYLLAALLVFHMVRVRSNTVTALAAAMLPFFTPAFQYGYEARGYGLMLGLAALAVFAWSEAARQRRRTLMLSLLTVSLAAGMWNHYYGALVILPIAVGELVRLIQRRRPDPGVFVACLAAGVLALPLLSMLATGAPQAKTFWTPDASIRRSFNWLLRPMVTLPFEIAGVVLALVCVVFRARGVQRDRSLPAHEVASGIVLAAMPLVCVVIARIASLPFVPRYAMTGVIGLSFVLPLSVWYVQTRRGAGEVLLAGFLGVAFLAGVGRSLVNRPVPRGLYFNRPVLEQALRAPETICVSSLDFLRIWYYLPQDQKRRVIYLIDPGRALKYEGTPAVDSNYEALSRWIDLPVEPYDRYLATHRRLRVYDNGGRGWLRNEIDGPGFDREEIAHVNTERLVEARAKPALAAGAASRD